MLIKSTSPKAGASPIHRPSYGEALAEKLATEEVPVKDLYQEGTWKFETGTGKTYQLDRNKAIKFMSNLDSARATYTVWGADGSYESLSKVDQQKRKQAARNDAIGEGLATTIFGGVLLAGGAAFINALDSVGGLLTRSGGGGNMGVGLGVIGALSGITGLLVGISSYQDGLQSPVAEIVQTGTASKEGQGFRFVPGESSADQREVLVM